MWQWWHSVTVMLGKVCHAVVYVVNLTLLQSFHNCFSVQMLICWVFILSASCPGGGGLCLCHGVWWQLPHCSKCTGGCICSHIIQSMVIGFCAPFWNLNLAADIENRFCIWSLLPNTCTLTMRRKITIRRAFGILRGEPWVLETKREGSWGHISLMCLWQSWKMLCSCRNVLWFLYVFYIYNLWVLRGKFLSQVFEYCVLLGKIMVLMIFMKYIYVIKMPTGLC